MAGKSARVTLTTHNQSVDKIHAIVASILGKAGCPHCGRLLNLELAFQGDPDPDLGKQGVVSVQTEGF